MEKGEQDFKYKVDQVQESLADAHKAHLRQVCPSLPFDIHTLPFDTLTLPFAQPISAHWGPLLCLLCLAAALPFNTPAMPFAYPTLPTACPCCASCAF